MQADAHAGFGVGGSVGGGFFVSNGSANRTSLNLAIDPFYKVGILYLDMGLVFDFEQISPQPQRITLTPGARLDFKLLYIRAAVPIQLNHPIDYGFLFGAGHMFNLGKHLAAYVEVDAVLQRDLGWSTVPIEFRGGMQYAF
jgi:hypothetical protein